MNEELAQLYILTANTNFSEEVKEDLRVFFLGLDKREVSDVLRLCKEDSENMTLVAQLLEKRKEALIQNDPDIWKEVLTFEKNLVEQESYRIESEKDTV